MGKRRLPVFPKVDAASPRGLMAPPGLTALGAKGSACERLRLTGSLRASAQGSYEVSLRWRGTAPFRSPFFMPPLAAKTFTTGLRPRKTGQPPCGRGNAFPLWWLAPPPCPVGSMSLDSRVARLPYESSSFATPASGGTITRAYCRAIYEESVSRCFILPLCTSCIGCASRSK